jgi:hypothetical protein
VIFIKRSMNFLSSCNFFNFLNMSHDSCCKHPTHLVIILPFLIPNYPIWHWKNFKTYYLHLYFGGNITFIHNIETGINISRKLYYLRTLNILLKMLYKFHPMLWYDFWAQVTKSFYPIMVKKFSIKRMEMHCGGRRKN